MAPSDLGIIIRAGPTSSRGFTRVLARADGDNLAVARLPRDAENLKKLGDGLCKETNGLLRAFPTDTQPENLRKAFQDIRNHDDSRYGVHCGKCCC